jgi:hypothetical protein
LLFKEIFEPGLVVLLFMVVELTLLHILYGVAYMPMLYVPAMLFMISFLYMDKVGKYKLIPRVLIWMLYTMCAEYATERNHVKIFVNLEVRDGQKNQEV